LGQSHSFHVEWAQVAADSGAGVLILDVQGRVLFINGVAAKVYARRSAREATGMRLSDFIPPSAATERMELVRQVIVGGETLALRELWGGLALSATVRRVDNAAEPGNFAALVVMCHENALLEESESAHRSIELKSVDFGPLAGLTASELKVMALIGEGMSNAEIAAKLHRAVKTVESHRAALTEKTGSNSRVQLGIMARRAGLLRRVALNDHNHAGGKVSV
jgi:DNA-binding NarL/FixJ family response regulator